MEDTGIGMAPEVRRRLFEPFFTTKGEQGTGLGLAIARWIVQRHGGEIHVESQSGQGTAVTLRFPAFASIPLAPLAEGLGEPTTSLTVVLIDDEPEVVRTLAEMLSRLGHQVKTAASGQEGLALLLEGPADLVLVDLGMREVDGWDILRAARERRPGLPIYLLTGYGATLDPEEVRRLGAVGLLTKPVSSSALASALAAFASQSRQAA